MRFILLFVGAIASKAEELQISSSGFVLLQRPGVTYASVVDIDSAKGYPLSREPLQLPNSSDTSVGLLELQPVLEREAARVVLSGGWTRWTPRKAHLHPHGVHAFLSSVVVFDWCLFASAIMVFLILHMLVLGRLSARGWHLTVLMIWLFVGFVYNAIIWARFGSAQGISWFAGYLLEYIFLVENIFIFHIIIQAFKTPAKMTPKALHIVVWGQIMFQMVFFMGLAVWLRQIKVLPYILGVWLICCGFLAARGEHTMEVEIMETRACRCFTSCLGDRLSPYYQKDGECLLRDDSGRMQVSLLGLTTFVLLLADFLLEIDVVLTKIEELPNPYIAFTSSAVAAFSIPELFFVCKGLMQRFVLLKYGIGFVLILFGTQMLLHSIYVLRPLVGCSIIVGVLAVCVVLSMCVSWLQGDSVLGSHGHAGETLAEAGKHGENVDDKQDEKVPAEDTDATSDKEDKAASMAASKRDG